MGGTVFYSTNSTEVTLITWLTTAILFSVMLSLVLFRQNNDPFIYRLIGAFFLLFIIAYCYTRALKKIVLTPISLIIVRNIGTIRVPIESLKAVQRTPLTNLTTFYGSKGFFGYNGNLTDGITVLVRNRRKMVLIETVSHPYLISCDKPQEFASMATRYRAQSDRFTQYDTKKAD